MILYEIEKLRRIITNRGILYNRRDSDCEYENLFKLVRILWTFIRGLCNLILYPQMKTLRQMLMTELENALAQQAPPPPQDDPSLHELPPLVIDGIPTPVEKMTQAQLRAFIPLMLKYSTGKKVVHIPSYDGVYLSF